MLDLTLLDRGIITTDKTKERPQTMTYTSNPIANSNLSNDELTEMIKNDRYARTLGNIARRAENLWEDGYSAKLESQTAHFAHYTVTTPAGERYSVCLSDTPKDDVFGDYCTCPAWGKYGECKHHLAVSWEVRTEAQADAFDKMMSEAESADGCDAYAEF